MTPRLRQMGSEIDTEGEGEARKRKEGHDSFSSQTVLPIFSSLLSPLPLSFTPVLFRFLRSFLSFMNQKKTDR